jgi:hypothetical protein
MKKNATFVLPKNEQVNIGKYWENLEYGGIENGNYTFYFGDCKISIPTERAECLEINKWTFNAEEPSQDSITLKYLGPKKRPKRLNVYKG